MSFKVLYSQKNLDNIIEVLVNKLRSFNNCLVVAALRTIIKLIFTQGLPSNK